MSLTDMVIMPGADYQDACEAIREKTGGTGYIRSGEMGEQIRSIPTGVELPELTDPASAEDIVLNKEAIDAEGNVISGLISDPGAGATHKFVATDIVPNMLTIPGLGVTFLDTVDFIAPTSAADIVFRTNSKVDVNVNAVSFGDATAEDVAAGKTFTSMAGLKVTGTAEVASTTTFTIDSTNYDKLIAVMYGGEDGSFKSLGVPAGTVSAPVAVSPNSAILVVYANAESRPYVSFNGAGANSWDNVKALFQGVDTLSSLYIIRGEVVISYMTM